MSLFAVFQDFLSLSLLPLCLILLYKIVKMIKQDFFTKTNTSSSKRGEAVPKQDMTLSQLRTYTGKDDTPICIAINNNIYDVTKAKTYYGADGPYALLAGQDASRALAKLSLHRSSIKELYDDLSDLNSEEWENLEDWERQFKMKYPRVGKLTTSNADPE